MKSLALGLAAALVMSAAAVFAQDYSGQNITSVNISGLERISDQAVRSKLEVQPGQPFDARAVASDIRRLYDQGYFTNIRAEAAPEAGGVSITYLVEEKRSVSEVKITGNDKLKQRRILGVLTMREGSAFVAEALEQERQAILDLYQSKGYANATVDIAAEKVGSSRVRVTYMINEGRKARIANIEIVGNDTLSKKQIKKVMETRKKRWFLGGKYEETKFEDDLGKIVDEYGNVGHLEADVAKTDVVYTGNGKAMNITIHVVEGPEYSVESLDVASNVVFDEDELLDVAKVHSGEVHNKGQVAADAQELERTYQDSGYVNADVTPQVTIDRENKTTHVVHNVEEGDLRYIRQVEVAGNEVTKDEIIRRQVALEPGERFDGTALEASQRRIERTGYFDKVRLTLDDVTDDRYTDLMVDVEEGDTGNFNFGGGYSTEDGVNFFGELRLNNFDITNWPKFSGGGQQLRARVSIGDRRDSYFLGWTDPQFLGYPFLFGVDIFDETYRVRGGADYEESERGIQLRGAKMLSEYVTIRTGLRFEETELADLPFFVNPEIRRQRGESTTISNMWEIERNTLDSTRDPSKGWLHVVSAEVAGLGGDNHFYRLQHDTTWYIPLDRETKKWIVSLRTREGFVTEWGDSDYVPLQDRFYAGGTATVRGYDTREIGPYVREYGWFGDRFATGGDLRLVTNAEIKYKVTEMFRLYGFWDAGGVWDEASDFDLGDIKHSLGLGIGFEIPRMGPIRIDYGVPINPEDYQGSGQLHLTTGFRF